MINHLFSAFLSDVSQYREAESYWAQLWERIDAAARAGHSWKTGWVHTGSPSILDGNPIFSAFSPVLRRGLRIIQHEPTSHDLEIQVWPNTFGGSLTDPESIRETVIACALSDAVAEIALDVMAACVHGRGIVFQHDRGSRLLPTSLGWSGEGRVVVSTQAA